MDQKKSVKRARSTTPTKEGSADPSLAVATKKKKTSKKKEKKNKSNPNGGPPEENSFTGQADANGIADNDNHTTNQDGAPAEEIMMAQMLLTFSNVEQARFAAYTRSKLPTRAVEDWITALLRDRLRQPPHASLADMVSTDQANDICWTVSMAAKIFAQRLVAEAIQYQTSAEADSASSMGGGPGPEAVWRAVQDRRQDMGLFLQRQAALRLNWSRTDVRAHQQARLATEQAQEDFDAEHAVTDDAEPPSMDPETANMSG